MSISSPKKDGSTPGLKDTKHRPSTPHPKGRPLDYDVGSSSGPDSPGSVPRIISGHAFTFAFADDECDFHTNAPSESCIGISLATVMNTFRGTPSNKPLPTSTTSMHEDDGNSLSPFHRFRSAVQKSLNCVSTSRTPRSLSSGCNDKRYVCDDRHVSFECDTFDQDRSLMQRAASWDTQETTDSNGKITSPSNRNVQFQYPPITSVRLRPRTRSEDVKQLFFAPEELDEIEDDRSDTKAADDIETLAVGAENWASVPTCTSSIVTASDYDDHDSSGLLLGDKGSNVMFDSVGSPRRNGSATDKRYVRGVQILLREKSTG